MLSGKYNLKATYFTNERTLKADFKLQNLTQTTIKPN